MDTLRDLFLDELADMYDAEKRITNALPKLVKAAVCPRLKQAFQSHLAETEGHIATLEQVFLSFGLTAKGKTCEATVGLLKEAAEITADFKGSPTIDAALICAAQKVEHYEIATYGCLHEWAILLGSTEATGLLLSILNEEKAADAALTVLARTRENTEALGEKEQNSTDPRATDHRAVTLRRTAKNSR